MRQPSYRLSNGGRQQPPAIDEAITRVLSAGINSRLYEHISNVPLDNGAKRKQRLRFPRFDAIRRSCAALLYCTDLATLAAGKRADGEVIGVSRKKILYLADDLCTRRFSRVAVNLHRTGLLTRRRRSGEGKGKLAGTAVGKATLFGLAKGLWSLLGIADLLEQARAQRAAAAADQRAQLQDRAQETAHGASSGRRVDGPRTVAEYLPDPPE